VTTPGLGILMILVTALLLFGSLAVVLLALLRGRRPRLVRLAIGLSAWVALYTAALVTTSLASEPRVLGLNESKRFCGFYLDCHTQVAIARVERLDHIGATRAAGTFHVITLRVANDARAARLRLAGTRITITDSAGHRYMRSSAGEAALAENRGPPVPLTEPIAPGGSFLTTVVFDLPGDARAPRLHVTDGWWADRLLEFFLVGDEDSFLHRKTSFRLTT